MAAGFATPPEDAAALAASRFAAGSSMTDAIGYISPRAHTLSVAMSWGDGPQGLAGALQLALSEPSVGLEGLEELLARGLANPREPLPDGTWALSEAARAGERSICATLLRYQADPNVVDGSPQITPLHSAVYSGDASLVSLLLAHRANVHAKDCAGQTPLFFAPSRPICQMLADAQADINVKNEMQQSALHLAAHTGMTETLEWLAAVADPSLLNAVDSTGCTAADYAARSRSKTAARLLRMRGGKRITSEQGSPAPCVISPHGSSPRCSPPCSNDLYAQGIRSRPIGMGACQNTDWLAIKPHISPSRYARGGRRRQQPIVRSLSMDDAADPARAETSEPLDFLERRKKDFGGFVQEKAVPSPVNRSPSTAQAIASDVANSPPSAARTQGGSAPVARPSSAVRAICFDDADWVDRVNDHFSAGFQDHPAASSTAISDQVIRRPQESPDRPPAPRRLNRGSSAGSNSTDRFVGSTG